ncbi:YveK family protein [Butyricicoccus sp.]|uniref:YveK family protein n=1 Tax=Butyricicoccus sp. TaxID=2049021 RepID=UPI003F135B98
MDNKNMIEIDLVDLFYYLRKRIWIVLTAALACGLAAFLVSTFVMTPQYTASTRIYILNKSEDAGVNYSDIQSASQLAKDYEVLITGRNVTSQVIEKLSLDMSDGELAKKISVKDQDETRIMQINVTDTDPERAAQIANCVRDVAKAQIMNIMQIDAVNVVYDAVVPSAPSSPNTKKNVILIIGLAVILTLFILVLCYIADDTIKTEEDVERYLQLTTIGIIPYSRKMAKRSTRAEEKKAPRAVLRKG